MPTTSTPDVHASRPPAAWHWPHFEDVLCGTMTERERLGMPEHFKPARFDAEWPQAYAHRRLQGRNEWLATLRDTSASLLDRWVCGQLLAETGDPRIQVFDPAMVDVPGGLAAIGLHSDEVDGVLRRYAGLGLDRRWIEKETPCHGVALKPFRMGRFPVTNLEYREYLRDTGDSEIPDSWEFRQFPMHRSNHPVYTVSARAADAYASWLSARTCRKFSLPTEAEWEWAAAGPQRREFPWGEGFDADRANTAETGMLRSSPVGVFVDGASWCGAEDMAGNVEEYVRDDYAPYPGGSFVNDHLVQIHGHYRVARGGSFARFRDLARNSRRHGHNPRSPSYAMGFRLVEHL